MPNTFTKFYRVTVCFKKIKHLIKMRFGTVILPFFGAGVFLISVIAAICFMPIINNESEMDISILQIAPAISEKAIYSGDELIFPFTCNCPSTDRWLVSLTATASSANMGYMTVKIDGVGEKIIRTGILRKISGTYTVPLYNKTKIQCQGKMTLRLKFSGGNKKEPLIYIAEMKKNENVAYQVAVIPENSFSLPLPKNIVVFPISLTQYKASGECKLD